MASESWVHERGGRVFLILLGAAVGRFHERCFTLAGFLPVDVGTLVTTIGSYFVLYLLRSTLHERRQLQERFLLYGLCSALVHSVPQITSSSRSLKGHPNQVTVTRVHFLLIVSRSSAAKEGSPEPRCIPVVGFLFVSRRSAAGTSCSHPI